MTTLVLVGFLFFAGGFGTALLAQALVGWRRDRQLYTLFRTLPVIPAPEGWEKRT